MRSIVNKIIALYLFMISIVITPVGLLMYPVLDYVYYVKITLLSHMFLVLLIGKIGMILSGLFILFELNIMRLSIIMSFVIFMYLQIVINVMHWEYGGFVQVGLFLLIIAMNYRSRCKSKNNCHGTIDVTHKSALVSSKSMHVMESTKLQSKLMNKKVNTTTLLPPLSLLHVSKNKQKVTWDVSQMQMQLLQVLKQFNIQGEIINALIGPVVTLFELQPEPGLKAQRVINLANDIARSMQVKSVRISQVLDRGVIGIELANPTRTTVYLRSLLESTEYQSADNLALAIGCDISFNPVIVDLATMPHMLMAGTTGSGKSVVIHAIILSLLYKHTPDTCKLILIDPKMLELVCYKDIPHLLTEVVTDTKLAVLTLKWAVMEMEKRYKLMAEVGVRNLKMYNQKNDRALPFIVIVIDEFADLMMVAGKEIDVHIQRLAQMARAAGMHVILATQRPSVDVITGTIKANFPARLALQVATKIDARTVLGDCSGAEQLLGKGDMLFLNGAHMQRAHGSFISEQEVEEVVNWWKQKRTVEYQDLTAEINDDVNIESDELTEQVWSYIKRTKRASISSVQREFGIGFNKAAKCLETLEKMGRVSEQDTMGRRKVNA